MITTRQFKAIAMEKGILFQPSIRKVDVEITELVPAALLEQHYTKVRLAASYEN